MMVSALESIKVRLRQSKNNKVMSIVITDRGQEGGLAPALPFTPRSKSA